MKGRVGIGNAEIFIGAEQWPDRKRPSLVVQRGNCSNIIGSFKSDECVEFFDAALRVLFGDPKKEDSNAGN